MSTLIRPIQTNDEPAWQSLWQQYNTFYERTVSEKVTQTTFARFLDGKTRMYASVAVAAEDNKIIGFVHWYPHPSTSSIEEVVYLHDLFVDPNARNGGVGRQLIEHVYEHAKTIAAEAVYWHTQFFNHRAQLLYVKVADRTDFVMYRKTLWQLLWSLRDNSVIISCECSCWACMTDSAALSRSELDKRRIKMLPDNTKLYRSTRKTF